MQQMTVEGRLLVLRERFTETLPQRVTAIAEILPQCRESKTATETLERLFHSLAGTAGTFGLGDVAFAALEGEDVCRDLSQGADPDSLQYLNSILDRLRQAA